MPIARKHLALIIAGVLGLLAAFLTHTYIQQQTDKAKEEMLNSEKNVATVVIARQDIPAGIFITENMLEEKRVSKGQLQPSAATAVERVVDKVAMAPIAKDEQVLLNKLASSGMGGSLSGKVPRGKRAITIPVDNISSVGGMLRPGDHVDIVGLVPMPVATADGRQATQMTSMPLFQDILVLAVGQEYGYAPGPKREERVAVPTVTLALSPQEANLVAFVQEQSKIRLILRSPEDTQMQQPAPASWDILLRTIMPNAFIEQPVTVKPTRKVEIYRGLQKEDKYLDVK